MPRGEPTRVVRLPVWLCDDLQARADAMVPAVSLPTYITRRLAPQEPVGRPDPTDRRTDRGPVRCTCKTPTLSKAVTNLCTTCRRLR